MNNDPVFVRINTLLVDQGKMQKDLIEWPDVPILSGKVPFVYHIAPIWQKLQNTSMFLSAF